MIIGIVQQRPQRLMAVSHRPAMARLENRRAARFEGGPYPGHDTRCQMPVHLREEVDPFDLVMAGLRKDRVVTNDPLVGRTIIFGRGVIRHTRLINRWQGIRWRFHDRPPVSREHCSVPGNCARLAGHDRQSDALQAGAGRRLRLA